MRSLLFFSATIIFVNVSLSQVCIPIDNRNVGAGGTHANICFFDVVNLNLGCLDCQLAGASGWKCGASFNAVSGFHHATVDGVFCSSALALPIELIDFTINNQQADNVSIQWSTASERDNDYFYLEHSRDGYYWEEVGIVKGSGTTSESKNYNFTDEYPFFGTSYYRLSQYDINGASSLLTTLSNELISTNYLLYPVPVNKSMFLEGNYLANSTVNVFNNLGELIDVEKSFVGEKLSFDFSNVKNGAYFVSIENEKTKKTERIIVVHK